MTTKTAAGRLRCFLSVEMESEGATDDTPLYDAAGYDLTYGDLREVLNERDQLAEKLAVATRTVAELAAQRDQLTAAVDRTTAKMREYQEAGCDGVNLGQVINLLSPTWPDGNYAAPSPEQP